MSNRFARTERLIGTGKLEKLKNMHVAIFGIGGVGGHACEAVARSGIGTITIVDKDDVDVTNINRQIIALGSTVGKSKVEVMKERILDINPDAKVNAVQAFFLPENAGDFDFTEYDYVIDAVDTVTAKIELVLKCDEAGTSIISSMGTGNKLDPTKFMVADIYKTSVCPLAKVMRKELKARGIKKLKVVYSEEVPLKSDDGERSPASISFVPPVAGLILAGEVIKDLIAE
ncbi:MAG: tRNA threonylcarbamoyladenosine dehydratase [Firmicutes bacterium]|nr:tRNA threonylcarbamoyladenosine dehydratase [Bacillota bacterium]